MYIVTRQYGHGVRSACRLEERTVGAMPEYASVSDIDEEDAALIVQGEFLPTSTNVLRAFWHHPPLAAATTRSLLLPRASLTYNLRSSATTTTSATTRLVA